jgi:hypothetical protein
MSPIEPIPFQPNGLARRRPIMPTAEDLIKALEAERDREHSLVETLSESERARQGTYDDWSAKDLLAHINAWKRQVVLDLREDPEAVPESTDEEVETANVAFYEANHSRPWDSILSDSESIHQSLVGELDMLSASELSETHRFPWQEGLPLWRRLAGWIFTHPWIHLAEHALAKEDFQGAENEAHQMVSAGRLISDDPDWTGALEYNAACIFARAGALDQAFQRLETALQHREDLIEASLQEDDLALLRSDERLEKIYASFKP